MKPELADVWAGCYDSSWNSLIVPEAFQHPAKYARGLITRIFTEMRLQGWLQDRDTVVDPFGGIACGGIVAAGLKLQWFGCELEEKFFKLGNQNIEMHRRTWEEFGDPIPVLVNGDSRKLRENLAGVLAQAVVSSPPYEGSDQNYEAGWKHIDPAKSVHNRPCKNKEASSVGQLGAMKAGTVDSVVTSPPFHDNGVNLGDVSPEGGMRQEISSRSIKRDDAYGQTDGQLGNLPSGAVDSVVSSPPYTKDALGHRRGEAGAKREATGNYKQGYTAGDITKEFYGDAPGNLGNDGGETFWTAAKQIVQECHEILKPGGVSAWVCKDFIRNKTRVEFCSDWCKLLEACGFKVIKRVRAMLVKEQSHPDLFGGEDHVDRKERKSFFRRLYEKKFPDNKIDWEEVIFAVK